MKIIINGEVVEVGGGGGSEDVYSTEETRIGTWIDGKPLYRKVILANSPSSSGNWASVALPIPNATVVKMSGTIYMNNDLVNMIPSQDISGTVTKICYNARSTSNNGVPSGVSVYVSNNNFVSKKTIIILEYTKTTDEPESAT